MDPVLPNPAAPEEDAISLAEQNRRFQALVVELLYKNAQLREALRSREQLNESLLS